MANNLVEARAFLLTAPGIDLVDLEHGADVLTQLGVDTQVLHLSWGTHSEFGRVREPLDQAIFDESSHPKNDGPLILIGPGISSSAAGLVALDTANVGGALLISPPEARFTAAARSDRNPAYHHADELFAEALEEADATQLGKLTYFIPGDAGYRPKARHVVFSYDYPKPTYIYDDTRHLFRTRPGLQAIVNAVEGYSKKP